MTSVVVDRSVATARRRIDHLDVSIAQHGVRRRGKTAERSIESRPAERLPGGEAAIGSGADDRADLAADDRNAVVIVQHSTRLDAIDEGTEGDLGCAAELV